MSGLSHILSQFCIIIVVIDGRDHNFRNSLGYKARSPVVGILAHQVAGHKTVATVPEVVVEFLESTGVQVVPLRYSDLKEMEYLLQRISGVWLPGGEIDVTFDHPYVKAARRIYEYSLERYARNDPFPLIGSCEGHQILAALAAGTTDVILKNAYKTGNVALNLQFEAKGGRMLGSFPPDVRQILQTKAVTPNLHTDGVPPEMWIKYEGLNKQFTMTSTSKDPKNGKVFSATMESNPGMAPMYGLQWHPEIIPYLWDSGQNGALVKTMDSFRVSYAFTFFVADLFHNKLNRFKSDSMLSLALIRNYPRACEESWQILDGYCVYMV